MAKYTNGTTARLTTVSFTFISSIMAVIDSSVMPLMAMPTSVFSTP